MSERAPIRSICVAGGGIVACSAALAFSRALPDVRVELVETALDPASLADRMPQTLPHVHRFHATIGFDERELVASGAATHLLGQRFVGWSASGDDWLHIFGDHGLPVGGASFDAVWQRARAAGAALPFHLHAAAGALAEAGKFVHPAQDPSSPFGNFLYGLRLDPPLYRERLREACERLPRSAGEIGSLDRREDGAVAALLLADGRRVEADLFVDATGPSAALLAQLDDAFEPWSDWLPFDRLRFAEAPEGGPRPVDEVTAEPTGWRLRSCLPDRILIVEVGRDAPDVMRIRTGRRPQPWLHNVLAIGDASVAVDPLHGANLHLAQSAILRALDLLPGRDMHALELREYNRRTEQETIRVRDFTALHHLRSGRRDGIWAELAQRTPPPSLARTLEQWQRRGRLPFFEEETFEKDSWLAALLGLGVMPEHVDPAATGVDIDRAAAAMRTFASDLRMVAASAPPYPDYLARMKAARRQPQAGLPRAWSAVERPLPPPLT